MAHGFVTTGLSFPDDTIQTTAGAITPPGAFALTKGSIPSGWLQCDALYSKTTYPALYAAVGNETNASMLPAFSTLRVSEYFNSNLGVSTGDRRVDRIATSGDGRWMVLGDAGRIVYSSNNGTSWTDQGQPTGTGDLYTICYGGNNTWIVAGVNKVWYTSNNGTNWTAGGGVLSQSFYGSAYNSQDNILVVSTSAGYFQRSVDGGVNWADVGLNLADRVYKLAWGGGYFVTGSNGSNIAYSTTNGASFIDLGVLIDNDNVNKMRYYNGRFFGVGDNGNIMYTKRNLAPISGNWIGTNLPIRGGTFDTTNELTDVSFIDSISCWFIGTNTTTYYWAYDTGQDNLQFYLGSGSFPATGQQGFNDSVCANGILIANHYTNAGTQGVASYNFSSLSTPPNTHFWVSGDYQNQGVYTSGLVTSSAPINIVKT